MASKDGRSERPALSKAHYCFRDASKGQLVCEQVEVADSFNARLKGLLFTKPLPPGYGLLLTPCASIHMFFMTYAIDAVFLDKSGVVIAVLSNFKPWRLSRAYAKAKSCLEMIAGEAARNGIKIGDRLVLEKRQFIESP